MLQLVSLTFILLNSVHCSSVLRCNERTDSNKAERTHKFAGNECHQMTVIRLTAQSVTRLQTEEHGWGGVGMHSLSVHNPFGSLYREVNVPAISSGSLNWSSHFFLNIFHILQNLPVLIYDGLIEHHERPRSETFNKISRQYAVL